MADRGLFSGENIDFLDEEGYEYVIATKRRWIKEIEKLMLSPIETGESVFAKEVKREGNRRYILCVNKDTEREEREFFRELRRSLEQMMKELSDSYLREGKGRKPPSKTYSTELQEFLACTRGFST